MKTIFERLVRFKDTNNDILYGEAPAGIDDLVGLKVPVYAGDTPWSLQATDKTAEIAEVSDSDLTPYLLIYVPFYSILTSLFCQVLCPLATTPIIYCVGLNYKNHIAENPNDKVDGKTAPPAPKHPATFTKPPDALNGPFSPVSIGSACADSMDYEGELTVVLGRDCKDIRSTQDALDAVLGYTVGNDVSCRQWQHPDVSGGQFGYSKSFDGYAPFGPVLVAAAGVPVDASSGKIDLELVTRVNGEERQRGRTGDMIFNVAETLVHLSRSTTLREGTVIMTGTPEGVALWMKPPGWVRDGDEV
jgi:2-keto-4-pentenoate hydratase/2-oxohepta-3-ene-1,7-dioic acid hydratase in catechol pathway